MAQQTAVEWLEEKYHYLLVEADINDMHVVEFDKKRNELFEQAKAMEKEQIIKARDSKSTKINRTTMSFEPIDGEQYYNERYGK